MPDPEDPASVNATAMRRSWATSRVTFALLAAAPFVGLLILVLSVGVDIPFSDPGRFSVS